MTPEPEIAARTPERRSSTFSFGRAATPASDVFGPYARSAEAELKAEFIEDDENEIVPAANSNTAPSWRAESLQRAAAASEPRVDVVLRRETAMVSLPLDAAEQSNGLINRIGQALGDLERAAETAGPGPLVLEPPPAERQSPDAPSETDISTETSEDDVTAIAVRLRPAAGEA